MHDFDMEPEKRLPLQHFLSN